MSHVRELLDAFPRQEPLISLARDEALLLQRGATAGRPAPAPEPLEVLSFSPVYVPRPFSPPTDIYENDTVRIELQDMNGRQPFYHRNLTVDEMSYQVTGPRMLITELGTVELEPGDFVRIPVGVAHDNWGRQEIHLLFYVQDRMHELLPAVRRSEPHVFRDWQPATVTEMLGDGNVRVFQQSDERLITEQVHADERRLQVSRVADGQAGTTWVWQSADVWIGMTRLAASRGTEYQRHRLAEEVQYQVSGRRTLISQHGCAELEPGDFVRIPRGCAFTSLCEGESSYITLLSATPLRRLAEPTRQADQRSVEAIDQLRLATAGTAPAR